MSYITKTSDAPERYAERIGKLFPRGVVEISRGRTASANYLLEEIARTIEREKHYPDHFIICNLKSVARIALPYADQGNRALAILYRLATKKQIRTSTINRSFHGVYQKVQQFVERNSMLPSLADLEYIATTEMVHRTRRAKPGWGGHPNKDSFEGSPGWENTVKAYEDG